MTEPKAVSRTNQQAQGPALNLKQNKATTKLQEDDHKKSEKLTSSTLTEISPNFFIFLSLHSFYFKQSLCVKHSMINFYKILKL